MDLFKKWDIPGLFFFIFVFSIQLKVNKIADDRIRTADLWHRKQPICSICITSVSSFSFYFSLKFLRFRECHFIFGLVVPPPKSFFWQLAPWLAKRVKSRRILIAFSETIKKLGNELNGVVSKLLPTSSASTSYLLFCLGKIVFDAKRADYLCWV